MLYSKRILNQGLIVFFFVIGLLLCSSSFAFFKKPHWIQLSKDEVTFWAQMSQDFTIESADNNPDVQKHIRWFQQHPKHLQHILMKAEPFIHYVYNQTHRYNLPAELALIPLLESQYNPAIGAPSGAVGLWQMMPGTARTFGLKINRTYDGRRDVYASTKAALNYLAYLHRYFNSNWLLALAAYDAGEGKVAAVSGRHHLNFWDLPLSKETREYVPRLLAIASIIRQPHRYNVSLPNIAQEGNLQELTWKEARSFNLAQAAKDIGIDDSTLRHYNPAIRHNIADVPGSITLLVPGKNLSDTQIEQTVSLPNTTNVDTNKEEPENNIKTKQPAKQQMPVPAKHYKVKKHDTLNKIAEHFHCSPSTLKSINHIKSNKLKVGSSLVIPNATAPEKTSPKTKAKPKKTSISYKIKSGDNLKSVAKKFHVTVKQLTEANHVKNAKQLQIGHSITIPSH